MYEIETIDDVVEEPEALEELAIISEFEAEQEERYGRKLLELDEQYDFDERVIEQVERNLALR